MVHKRTPDSLRQGEKRLRRLAESNIIGLAVGDLNGKMIEANDAFLKLVGYSRQELASGTIRWDSLTPPEYSDLDRRAIDQLRTTGIALPWEKEFLHKSGDRVFVLSALRRSTGQRAISSVFPSSSISPSANGWNRSCRKPSLLQNVLIKPKVSSWLT